MSLANVQGNLTTVGSRAADWFANTAVVVKGSITNGVQMAKEGSARAASKVSQYASVAFEQISHLVSKGYIFTKNAATAACNYMRQAAQPAINFVQAHPQGAGALLAIVTLTAVLAIAYDRSQRPASA